MTILDQILLGYTDLQYSITQNKEIYVNDLVI